jgi:hypothetical protein
MRQVTAVMLVAVFSSFWGGRALATPFEPGTVPEHAEVIGHLDVDALRRTQLFSGVGGQAALDKAINNHAPDDVRPLARALAQSLRGVSFWRDGETGAAYLQTRDSRGPAQLLKKLQDKLPTKAGKSVDGIPVFAIDDGEHDMRVAAFGDTLVVADSDEGMECSIRVLSGKKRSLAGSKKLPSASRQGVFVFVAVGDDLLNAIQKSARAKMLQLSIQSIVVDVGESAGLLVASARAEMRSADAVDKGKSILEGLRALASLSDDPRAKKLLDAVTVTSSGNTLEVIARVPIAEIMKALPPIK